MDHAGDRLWFIGSHRGRRLDLDPELSDAQNLSRLSRVEPIQRRACLGHARITAEGLPQPRDLALLPIGDGGNDLTRALLTDPHLGPSFAPRLGSMAVDALNGCEGPGLAGLAYNAGRLWIGLSAPVLGGFAVLLEIEPREERRCILGLQPIGVDRRPYRKHLVHLNGLGVQALRWQGDSLLILAGVGAEGAAGQSGIYQLRDAAKLGADSLTLADDARLTLRLPLADPSTPGNRPLTMELYDGLGQPGVMVVPGTPPTTGSGSPGVVAEVYVLNAVAGESLPETPRQTTPPRFRIRRRSALQALPDAGS